MGKKIVLPAEEIPDEKIEDLIDKKCANCSFWYNRYCCYHKQATFAEGLCEYYHMSKILPLKQIQALSYYGSGLYAV